MLNQEPAGRPPIRVALIEDDDQLKLMYGKIISQADGLELAALFNSCETALEDLDDILPHVILMDIGLPGMDGIEGTHKIKTLYPSIDIIMLTIYDDDDKIFRSICAGASGYILKNAQTGDFIQSIRDIQFGSPMSAPIARRVLNLVRQYVPAPTDIFKLTKREMDILQRLVEGDSDKQIADRLFISPHTVNSHLKRIYEKLHVHSKAQAVMKAFRNRLF